MFSIVVILTVFSAKRDLNMRIFIVSSCFLLALTGCKPLWNPTFMPSGYSYHQKEYKSPPGPEAAPIGYKYSYQKNEEVLETWRSAIRDMLLRAQANGMEATDTPVYLTTDMNDSVFKTTYDAMLREGLNDYGYTFADDPEGAIELFYSAGKNMQKTTYNGDAYDPIKDGSFIPESEKLKMILQIKEDGEITNKVEAFHDIPLYGFKTGAYFPSQKKRAHASHSDMSIKKESTKAYNE